MDVILEFITQIETMIGAGVTFILLTLYQVRRYFKSGKGIALIVAYAGNKLIELFTSDNPETQKKAEVVLDGVLKLPRIQELFNKVDSSIAERLIILEKELADVEHKLSLDILNKDIEARYLSIKSKLEQKINELNQ